MSRINQALKQLSLQQDLTEETAQQVMLEIMTGKASATEISAYLMGLAVKNESIPEIIGSAKAMLRQAVPIPAIRYGIDIVGTGGDQSQTFNISTTASFIVSAAGVPVVKHGNRAASSQSGTADVLEALNIEINMTADQATRVFQQTGHTFLFARSFHPAMQVVGPIRSTLGIRTVFNVLGPLTNPARPQAILMGVYDKQLLKPLAKVLKAMDVKSAVLVHGQDGLDEVTLTTKTDIVYLRDGQITATVFDPQAYGFTFTTMEQLRGGTPEENAQLTLSILTGDLQDKKRDIVILNAALALFAAQVRETIAECIGLAQQTLASGLAFQQLVKLQAATQEISQ